jgi:Zn-dependent protease
VDHLFGLLSLINLQQVSLQDHDVNTIIDTFLALLIAIDVHELSHALVADSLGDDTPRLAGHITLNPFRHMDQFGILLLIMLSVIGTGFAYGFTPVNETTLRRKTRFGPAIVSLAGPMANLLLAALVAIPLSHYGVNLSTGAATLYGNEQLYNFLVLLFVYNVFLAVFNLIPLPPLDGWTIVSAFLSRRTVYEMRSLIQYGPLILLLLFVFEPNTHILGNTVYPIRDWVANQLLRL